MSVKKFNPVTPGLRHKIANTYAEVTTDKPEKSLLASSRTTAGRNVQGHMTDRKSVV